MQSRLRDVPIVAEHHLDSRCAKEFIVTEPPETHRSAYPKRPRFFSHRFTRLMARVCLANEIGPEACWLLAVIVNTEDAKGYRGPVTYFNDQLMNVTGFGSVPSLDRFRAKAVKAGWLHYEAGVRRRAGVYWVTIPSDSEDVKDGPIDHDDTEYRGSIPSTNGTLEPKDGDQAPQFPSTGGSYAEGDRKETVQESGRKAEGNRSPIFPSPNPNPREDPPNPPKGGMDEVALKKIATAEKRRARDELKKREIEAVINLTIPAQLDTPAFREAWSHWQACRIEKKKHLTPSIATSQLKKLAKEGVAAAIDRLETSSANGWQGLWMPNEKSGASRGTRQTARPDFFEQGRAAYEAKTGGPS